MFLKNLKNKNKKIRLLQMMKSKPLMARLGGFHLI